MPIMAGTRPYKAAMIPEDSRIMLANWSELRNKGRQVSACYEVAGVSNFHPPSAIPRMWHHSEALPREPLSLSLLVSVESRPIVLSVIKSNVMTCYHCRVMEDFNVLCLTKHNTALFLPARRIKEKWWMERRCHLAVYASSYLDTLCGCV